MKPSTTSLAASSSLSTRLSTRGSRYLESDVDFCDGLALISDMQTFLNQASFPFTHRRARGGHRGLIYSFLCVLCVLRDEIKWISASRSRGRGKLLGLWNARQQLLDHLVRGDAFGLSGEIAGDAVAQDRRRDSLDIIAGCME